MNRDPSAVRLMDYNYDPSFGNPIGRAFKLGLSKQFRQGAARRGPFSCGRR
jgi:hypothetical protein